MSSRKRKKLTDYPSLTVLCKEMDNNWENLKSLNINQLNELYKRYSTLMGTPGTTTIKQNNKKIRKSRNMKFDCCTNQHDNHCILTCKICYKLYHIQCLNMDPLEYDLISTFTCINCTTTNKISCTYNSWYKILNNIMPLTEKEVINSLEQTLTTLIDLEKNETKRQPKKQPKKQTKKQQKKTNIFL